MGVLTVFSLQCRKPGNQGRHKIGFSKFLFAFSIYKRKKLNYLATKVINYGQKKLCFKFLLSNG